MGLNARRFFNSGSPFTVGSTVQRSNYFYKVLSVEELPNSEGYRNFVELLRNYQPPEKT